MSPKIYRTTIVVESYVQADSPGEADRIARSRITDIVDNDPFNIVVDDEPVNVVPPDVAGSLPWVSYLYNGPEYTVQEVINLNK
jgi:hypothetical protein